MSKTEVMQVLRACNGRGTLKELAKKAEEMFPNYRLHTYIHVQLARLRDDGSIMHDAKTGLWWIPEHIK